MGVASAKTNTLRLPPIPKGYKAFKAWIAAALRRIGQLSDTSIQIDGADGASVGTDGTLRFKVGGGGAAATQGLDVGSDGKVIAATVMGVMPTISVSGTPVSLDDATPPLLSIGTSGTKYITVNVTGTFSLKGSTFVLPTFSAAPTVTITVETSDPGYAGTHSVSTGTFKFLLATFVDGVKTAQNGHGPITAEICDSLNGDAKANLNLTWASA